MKYMLVSTATALVVALGVAGSTCAEGVQNPGSYVSVNLGSGVSGNTNYTNVPGFGSGSIHPNAGFFGSVAFGRALRGGFALEGEGLYTHNTIVSGASFGAYGGLVNANYAIARVGPVIPYVGAGVGYGGVKYTIGGLSSTSGGLMWQAKAGLSYPVDHKLSLALEYRYLDTPHFDYGNGATKAHTALHVISFGVRGRF